MSTHLTIAQVTDPHIGRSDLPYRGIHARQQFAHVLQTLAKIRLDLLVVSGDLAAAAGEPEAYAWLKETLAAFPYPYVVMPGNHDHVPRLARAFKLPEEEISNGMLYFSRQVKERWLLFLDSSPYRVAPQQLTWLKEQFLQQSEPALLFIHHPPLHCGCQFMDERHALQNTEEVWSVLTQLSQIKHIFCGHYHAEKTILKEDKYIHLTPSTIFQIDTRTPHFVIEHTRPGWRIIEWNGSQVHTYVNYLSD
jgi:Icc protein